MDRHLLIPPLSQAEDSQDQDKDQDLDQDAANTFSLNSDAVKRIEPRDIINLDFSDVGLYEPTFDIANLFLLSGPLSPNYSAEQAEAVAREMVAAFHASLVSEAQQKREMRDVAKVYSLEQCWQQFCRTSLERWSQLIAFAAMNPKFGNPLFNYLFERLDFIYNNFFLKYAEGEKSFVCVRPLVFN
jgi:hypothetical protein